MRFVTKRATAAVGGAELSPRFPGIPRAMDGTEAVVAMETGASEAAGAYPITPSTQMGEGWAMAVADGRKNVFGRRLLFFEPEGEHAAAAVTAGMSMVGLRAANFSSGQGIVYMHESLYPAVGKRLTYVLNVACRAITKQALNIHAGHDDYHAVDDSGFFQLFAKNAQEAADLTLIAHRVAELSLNPGISAQDGFLTSHVIESLRLPEPELVREYLGDPSDLIESPTPAQRLVFGDRRRRIPELFDLDYPAMLGVVQNQDSYMQGVAAQRPFYFDHLAPLTDRAMEEYRALTGRGYARASGYRLDDAIYVLAGQGSVVSDAEAVCDHLREKRGLRVGVLNLTMFRPFPADLVVRLLAGKRAVTVLERVDQPLASDPPMLREIRAAVGQALENGRGREGQRHPGIPAVTLAEVPDFHAACFGLGSRDLQAGDLVAAVENMIEGGERRRRYYLGIDFVRPRTRLPKLQIHQERLLEAYPGLKDLALPPAAVAHVLPEGAVSVRIHSVGGWGAMTTGKNLAVTAFELMGFHVKANPRYGSEKKGQPTAFYLTLARQPVRSSGELRHVNVVLSPDPNVFRHSNPLAGLAEAGVFVIQSDLEPDALWASLPSAARNEIQEKGIRLYGLDGFRIAADEASDPELRYRMQGAAFMGAFFAASPLMEREGLDETRLFEGIRAQLHKKFGHRGAAVVEDNLRVIRRGFEELRPVDTAAPVEGENGEIDVPRIPSLMDVADVREGIADPGRFWEQVCALCKVGQDPLADPFAAVSAMPAATSAVRDMTDIRLEVPEFIAERCTGCSQCWVQCPDSAIPALVNSVEDVLGAAVAAASGGRSLDRLRQVLKPLARETRKALRGASGLTFADALSSAYSAVADRLGWDPERRRELDGDFARLMAEVAEYPVARTAPFFDLPESKEKGSGGLLSIVINPETCKGCNLCVEVCPDEALVTVRQTEEVVDRMRRSWGVWKHLPDTDDRYVNIASLDEGIGVLSSLLLKRENYLSMVGGDGACMGCGEKTGMHLVVSAIHALMGPRAARHVEKLEALIQGLERKARELLAAEADIQEVAAAPAEEGRVVLPLGPERRARLQRITGLLERLRDLRWRYVQGPGGKGRARLAMTNATGCSSVWGSTYPYNPYPFPWTNHLFQDAPSLAIGIFEGHMRKMADGFLAIRRAELELEDAYDAEVHEAELDGFDWRRFSDEEFALCPPIVATGGDGAMLDIGFQNLSRLMASGKPVRVIVLDTQVYSNTGGQACTSGFTGQVSDMAAYGRVQHGKQEVRKELGLIAMAHRGVFVHQSSQASASHLLEGVLKGLQVRRPAVFNLYTPCPVEHGTPDDGSMRAARLALESRAFPFLTFDPDAGRSFAECLSLEGNPSPDDPWPTYRLSYVEDGEERELELPLTIADWAATEGRFRKHFRRVDPASRTDEMIPFHEYVALDAGEREGRTPFIHALGRDGALDRLAVADEIVRLAEERLLHWAQLRELAGLELAPWVRSRVEAELEAEYRDREKALRAEHDAALADLRSRYPLLVARRLAEGLLRVGNGNATLTELLARAEAADLPPLPDTGGAGLPFVPAGGNGAPHAPRVASPGAAATTVAPAGGTSLAAEGAQLGPAPVVAPEEEEEDEDLALEPYIDTERCTTCDECININNRMFAYNENKQAYIKDPRAGTFAQLVQAAEKCTVEAIHPGTPLNPAEKDLAKWVKRAERFG